MSTTCSGCVPGKVWSSWSTAPVVTASTACDPVIPASSSAIGTSSARSGSTSGPLRPRPHSSASAARRSTGRASAAARLALRREPVNRSASTRGGLCWRFRQRAEPGSSLGRAPRTGQPWQAPAAQCGPRDRARPYYQPSSDLGETGAPLLRPYRRPDQSTFVYPEVKGDATQVEPLPRGRHKLTRRFVRDSQRARLVAAMLECVAASGYADTTIANVVAKARVSRRAFYELFKDKEDCFRAACEQAGAERLEALYELAAEPTWTDAVRKGAAVYLRWWQDRPGVAAAYLVELPGASRGACAQRAPPPTRFA